MAIMSFYQKSHDENTKSNSLSVEDAELPLLITLQQNIQLLKRKVVQVGTDGDSITLREDIEKKIIPTVETLIDKLEEVSLRASKDKLVRDFETLKVEYRYFQHEYGKKSGMFPLPKTLSDQIESGYESMPIQEELENTQIVSEQSEQTPLLLESVQRRTDRLNQDELDFHTIIQQERSQDISKIRSAVQEVNAIFKQLGSLVQEQGEQVDTIADNVTGLSDNIGKAHKQLNKANDYQRRKNRCGTITLVIVIVITLITLLAILS